MELHLALSPAMEELQALLLPRALINQDLPIKPAALLEELEPLPMELLFLDQELEPLLSQDQEPEPPPQLEPLLMDKEPLELLMEPAESLAHNQDHRMANLLPAASPQLEDRATAPPIKEPLEVPPQEPQADSAPQALDLLQAQPTPSKPKDTELK